MTKWKQVSGDVDFSGTGCVLARDNPSSRDVDLVKIIPWLEMDSSALTQGYGFWDVSRTTIDYDDMNAENDDVRSAIKYVGVDAEEYQKLNPADKAAVIAEYSGYGESTSTSNFAKTLPAPIGQIEFWAGSENHDVEGINDDMRREVTSKLYGGKFRSSGRLPTDEALELAFGSDPHVFELSDDEAQAVRYALAVASNKYTWPAPHADDRTLTIPNHQRLKSLLEILRDAPNSVDLPAGIFTRLQAAYESTYDLDWDDKREQVAHLIDQDAKEARLLIDNLLGNLGF